VKHSGWVKLDSTYHVLAIWIEPGRTRLRLVGEQTTTPALFEPEMFEVVSSTIPSNWVITSPKMGFFEIGPEAWTRPGFWEEYFDRKPEAIACFEEERKRIVASDS
jgi:hypothetical protein